VKNEFSSRRAKIEAAIRRLPILPSEEQTIEERISVLAAALSQMADESEDNGKADESEDNRKLPAHFREANDATICKSLQELQRRAAGLAQRSASGGSTVRARQQLALLIDNLSMPAIEALGSFKTVSADQTSPATLNMSYIRIKLPPLLRSGESVHPDSLRLLSEAAGFALRAPERGQNPGRTPNLRARAIAQVVTKTFKDLTGREATFTQSGDGRGSEAVTGAFISFAREVFDALEVPHDPLSFVARSARAVRGVGRKK
jgi:hypothetical protein